MAMVLRVSRQLSLAMLVGLTAATGLAADDSSPRQGRQRRILYNSDGDSCMSTRAGSKEPVAITTEDLKRLVAEITDEGSGVDTLLICINAQVMYYPTKVGTMRGSRTTPARRSKWPASEQQRFRNMERIFSAGIDPYAVILAEARQRGLEALLTFRMNDAHGNEFLRTKFWIDHPQYRLRGGLDFGHQAVRDYVFRLIQEAVRRYDCDGIELDFNRFPRFFKDHTTAERVVRMNSLVERVHRMIDEESKRRGRKLILAARVPSNFGKSAPTPDSARKIGCDVAAWVKNGWIDFLTVSEFLHVRYDLPIAPWKKRIDAVPIYGSIECAEGRGKYLTSEKYRRAARHLWRDGADGIYLFNFFVPREGGPKSTEPPFEVLRELGDKKAMLAN